MRTRVMLLKTTDQFTNLTTGAMGYVDMVDSVGTVHVTWDDGSSLGLVPGEDEFKTWPVLDQAERDAAVVAGRAFGDNLMETLYDSMFAALEFAGDDGEALARLLRELDPDSEETDAATDRVYHQFTLGLVAEILGINDPTTIEAIL